MGDDSHVSFVVQYLIDKFVRNELSLFTAEILCFQFACDRLCPIALRILSVDFPYYFCLRLIDVIFFVFQVPTENISSARGVSFQPAFFQTTIDLLFQVFGKVFVESLDDCKKELSFGRIGNVLQDAI